MMRPQARRRRYLAGSFLVAVVLPVLLSALYYAFFVSDRYVAGAGFAVRGVNATTGLDGIGALTGLASTGTTTSESYIILKYLRSRDLVERLDNDIGIRDLFAAPQIDRLSRISATRPIEDFVTHWGRMIDTSFDTTSGIVTFEAQAFSPADADRIARLVLGYIQDLVNQLSDNARQDALRFARQEVAGAEARLRDTLQQLRAFRDREQLIDPAATAQIDIELIGALEARLVDIRARMAAIGDRVSADAPALISLRHQAEALETQIAIRSAGISSGMGAGLSDLLAQYEALEVEKAFAQQSYASALASLEQARLEADRQQRYLAVYSHPALPQDALYPRRALTIVLIGAAATTIWAIGALITYAVRDHLT